MTEPSEPRPRRIAHLTSVHPPFDTRIFVRECGSALAAGYEVTLVAAHDRSECRDGIDIRAVPRASSRLRRMLRTTWQVFREARRAKADLYQFHDPELIPVGLMLKLLGHRVVADIHEDLPKQVLSKPWIPRPLRRAASLAVRVVESTGAWAFDGVVAAEPDIADRFPPKKTVLVQNFPIADELAPPGASGSASLSARPANVLYVGSLSRLRGMCELVRAIESLPKSLDARLLLAGKFESIELERELSRMPGWRRVDAQGHCSRDRVRELMGVSRIGIVTLLPCPKYVAAYPTKLFEYMSGGLPVIASDFPLWRRIVESAGCGLLVDPERPEAIAEAIHWLLEHPAEADAMGRRGRQAVLDRYDWANEAEKLLAFYDRLLGACDAHCDFDAAEAALVPSPPARRGRGPG
ncbi:MAG: glycosyltransferase family 4 protein [Planctomycetaceae bacterium]